MRKRSAAILILCATGAALVGLGSWHSSRVRSQGAIAPRYVGDSSCGACHRTITDSYQRTAMGRAWYLPEPGSTVEDYTTNNVVYDAQRDLHYEMLERDSRYFQREYRLDDRGETVHELLREVAHVVGSGEHVRSYTTDDGGYLTQMPISWYSEQKKWGLSPGYQQYNHRFSRPMTPSCVACHNDYPPHPEPTQNHYAAMPTGIGCERCHGPAEWHVREESEGWTPPASSKFASIVNPARLPPERTNDVCFQCHLQGDVQFPFPGAHEFGFQPGMKLADFRSDYLMETADLSRFGVASHATRMVLSQCSVASNGKLTCVTCHDPHVPLEEVMPESYRRSCMKCHQPDSCRRTPDTSEAHRADNCVACHMPRGEPEDVQHTVFTDHWIQRPGSTGRLPSLSRASGSKESESAVGGSPESATGSQAATQPVPLHDFWRDDRLSAQRAGIAHIAFALGKGGRSNLDHGIELLLQASRSGDLHRDGWRKLGVAALVQPDPSLAVVAFRNALRHDDRDGVSRLGLGSAYQSRGDVSPAIAELERVVRDWPEMLEAYPALASLYMTRQQSERAIGTIEECLRRAPSLPDAWRLLGMILSHIATEPDRAADAFRRAIQLEPDDPVTRTAFASLQLRLENSREAKQQLEHAVKHAPSYLPAWLALADLHIKENNHDEARRCLNAVLKLHPDHPHATQLMRELNQPAGSDTPQAAQPRE